MTKYHKRGFDRQNIARVPHRFHGQVTYNDWLQVYMFIDDNALVPLENSMYVFFINQQKQVFNMIQKLCSLDRSD